MRTSAFRTALLLAFAAWANDPLRAQNVVVAEFDVDAVVSVSPAGAVGPFSTVGVSRPRGLAMDGAGNVYVGNDNSTITRYSPGGQYLGVFAQLPGGPAVMDIAFDRTGCLYAATGMGGEVRKFSPAGADLGAFVHTSTAWGVAFEASGNLLVSAYGDNLIYRYTSAGELLGTLGGGGLSVPCDIAVDPQGFIYAANFTGGSAPTGTGTVRRFSPAGVDLGNVASGLQRPIGLAFDATGNLLVSDYYTDEIRRYTTAGVPMGVFASGLHGPLGMVVVPGPAAWAILLLAVQARRRRRRTE